jgi:glycosyltransferase involved in cell wall biosynthesis
MASAEIGLNAALNVSPRRLTKQQAYQEADVLDIHANFSQFFSYLWLPKLTRNKPAVLTLCDMWAYTGHCHYSYGCERWKSGCGECPYPDAYPPIKRDNTALEWKLKNWAYSRSKLTVVTKSRWSTEQVKQSILNRFPIQQIHNGVDTETYQPRDSQRCRLELGLPLHKKVLMFSAKNLSDHRKGGDLLLRAIQDLPASLKAETILLAIGQGGEALAKEASIQTFCLGFVSSAYQLAICYAAADLFLFPTRNELFGNVALESIACGTPVVSFRVGGVPDTVRPGITGYLAEPENTKDFCNGIVQLLEDELLRKEMGQQGRAIAVQEFAQELQVQQYITLYRQLLQN